jgi:ribonuclease Y
MDIGIDKFIIVFLAVLTLILSLIFWSWQKKLVNRQEKLRQAQAQQQKKEVNFIAREEKLRLTQITLANQTKNFQQEEKRVNSLSEKLLQKEKIITEQIEKYGQKEQRLEERERKLHQKEKENNNWSSQIGKLQQEAEQKLREIAQMDEEEAQEMLFSRLKEKIKESLDKQAQKEIKRSQARVEEEINKIICSALEKYSSELVYSRTVNRLKINDGRTMGRIIGKDGRNINFFRKITGTEILIPENDNPRTKQKKFSGKSKKDLQKEE